LKQGKDSIFLKDGIPNAREERDSPPEAGEEDHAIAILGSWIGGRRNECERV